jgi:hypothetical protein
MNQSTLSIRQIKFALRSEEAHDLVAKQHIGTSEERRKMMKTRKQKPTKNAAEECEVKSR